MKICQNRHICKETWPGGPGFLCLNKVKAFKIFPGCKIVIKGHTDSSGGNDVNRKLSSELTEAVMAGSSS
jgi:hypothetical protein